MHEVRRVCMKQPLGTLKGRSNLLTNSTLNRLRYGSPFLFTSEVERCYSQREILWGSKTGLKRWQNQCHPCLHGAYWRYFAATGWC